jgi:hypothetical protein
MKDLKGVVIALSNLAHELVSSHTSMGSGPSIGYWNDSFKNTPVFFEYNRYMKTGDLALLDYLYTFLNFGKKFEFVDKEFHETAFRGWLGIEQRLKGLEFSDIDVESLRTIIHHVLPDLNPADFWPKHGPGSVSERGIRSIHDKHSAIRFHGPINSFLTNDSSENFNPEYVVPHHELWNEADKPPSVLSRLQFVPKSMKVARSICMEPATNMFFQQGLKAQMYKSIEMSPFGRFIRLKDQGYNRSLAEFGSSSSEIDTIDLSSASDSVHLELVKRIFPDNWLKGMLATRSDKVVLPDGTSHDLTKFAPMGSALCFPVQCIIFASICVYAAHLYRKGFPHDHQELVQALDVDKAFWLYRHHTFAYEREGLYLQPLGVFGDDICCDRRVTDYIESILFRLGFTVNVEKTFTGSQSFRESCGIFCLGGREITPLYFRVTGLPYFQSESLDVRKPVGRGREDSRETVTDRHSRETSPRYSYRRREAPKISGDFLAVQVHTINEARRYQFRYLYRFLIHILRSSVGKSYPFKIPWVSGDSTEFGIHASNSENIRNSHLNVRYNPDLQRDEYEVWSIVYRDRFEANGPQIMVPYRDGKGIKRFHKVSQPHEGYLYMRWWAQRYDYSSSELNVQSSHIPTAGSRIKRRWTPLY